MPNLYTLARDLQSGKPVTMPAITVRQLGQLLLILKSSRKPTGTR